MPKGTATKQAYLLHMNADGTFQEQGVALKRSELVTEISQDAIGRLETARKEGLARDIYFDVHNQRGIAAIREHFANRPAVEPETAPQPSESDS